MRQTVLKEEGRESLKSNSGTSLMVSMGFIIKFKRSSSSSSSSFNSPLHTFQCVCVYVYIHGPVHSYHLGVRIGYTPMSGFNTLVHLYTIWYESVYDDDDQPLAVA